jgi:hypothetical protein
MLRRKVQEKHRMSRFKGKRFGYELWELIQKFMKLQQETIDNTHRKFKWNDYKLIRRMLPHGTTCPIDVESGIQ